MSPDYIGASAPVQRVAIRYGYFARSNPGSYRLQANFNQANEMMKAFPLKAHVSDRAQNSHWGDIWNPAWTPITGYVDIPGVLDVKLGEKTKSEAGIDIATVEIDNIAYPALGAGGHGRERGFASPLRGYYGPGTIPLLDEAGAVVGKNAWSERFFYATQVTIWQGWGAATLTKVFTGLVEDIDNTSRPDRITLTSRNFGQVFSDTNLLGFAHDPHIGNSIVFADEELATEVHPLYKFAGMSSYDGVHQGYWAFDGASNTWWNAKPSEAYSFINLGLDDFAAVDSLRVTIPPGHGPYTVWVSIRATATPYSAPLEEELAMKPGEGLDANLWVLGNLHGPAPGNTPLVTVEGKESQSVPYVQQVVLGPGTTTFDISKLGEQFTLGKNSVIRLSFDNPGGGAAVIQFEALQLKSKAGAAFVSGNWVLVHDISDVIRVVCAWAGFPYYEIENTGARLPKVLKYDRTKTYMDVIKEVEAGCGFSFFMKDPTANEEAIGGGIGVPCWRKTRVVLGRSESGAWEDTGAFKWDPRATITDRSLLTAIDMKHTSEPLRAVIRTYGTSGVPPSGAAAGITGERLVATFRPPWAGRLAGVLKQLSYKDELFSSHGDLRNAAYFIALQEALESIQATIEIPGFPGIEIDDHIELLDLGTGLSTRMAIEHRSSSMVSGEHAKWTMTLGGPLIDTPDVVGIVNIINGVAAPEVEDGEWGITEGVPTQAGYR